MVTKRAQRAWGTEVLLPISHLVKKRLPVDRGLDTWKRWFYRGVTINGQRHELPQIEVAGVVHSSVEAIADFFNHVGAEELPDRRESA